jgi:hypothetical protein
MVMCLLHQACAELKAALLALRASGEEGFEGLVRDAYREVTGVSLSLQKSGRQGGADAVPPGARDEIAAAIEAKRYRDNTSLPLDELKAKLLDAATRSENPVELWILCASKEISGDDAAGLQRIGDQHGIGTLILDWKSDADPLAPLPLLLALAPGAVARHLGERIAESLSTVEQHPEFAAQKAKLLERLASPDLCGSYAAHLARQRIAETIRTRHDAKSRLQNPVDLGAPLRIWEPRDNHCQKISEWAQKVSQAPVCALLGEEGAGKTWLMFDWWKRETETEDPPLILWLSAREVASGALIEIIAAGLVKWVSAPRRDVAFWVRRLELWRRTRPSPGKPIVWLMLDGVNEAYRNRR